MLNIQNSQSIMAKGLNKLDGIRRILHDNFLDIVGVSETWLKSYITNSTVSVPGYKLFRNDRAGRRGGGVALYVSTKLSPKVIMKSTSPTTLEYLFVEIRSGTSRILVGVVYRTDGELDLLSETFSSLTAQYDSIIMMGDFNLNLMESNVLQNTSAFFDNFQCKIIHNNKPTHFDVAHLSSSLIDFFVVSNTLLANVTNQFWIPAISKHSLIFSSFNIFCSKTPETYTYRDYSNLNLDHIISQINITDLDPLLSTNNVDEQLAILNSVLLESFNLNVPLRTKTVRPESNPWFNSNISDAISLRDMAFRAYNELKTQDRWRTFCKYRNRVNSLIKSAKKRFGETYYKLDQPPKKLWQKISNIGLNHDNSTNCNVLLPDSLNNHFASQQSGSPSPPPNYPITDDLHSHSFRNVTEEDLWTAVCSIKSNATGLDNIPIKFVKFVLPIFSKYILHIINTIFTTSTYPTSWKMAMVVPIPKISDPVNLSDFRPISILPALSKVCEILIKDQIMVFLNAGTGLHPNQSGFRKSHSTTTAVLDLTDTIRSNIDKKLMTVLLLLDFSKAFDSINHAILLSKLKNFFSFSSSAISLIHSYLNNRLQCVVIGEQKSSFLPLFRGVPQGSILGPLLFSLFINDLPSVLRFCLIHLFADDVQIANSSSISNPSQCIREINEDLVAILNWATGNELILNPLKSQAVAFYRFPISHQLEPVVLNGSVIPYSSKAKSLGFILDETLSWDCHVNLITGRVWMILRKLYLVKDFLTTQLKAKLVQSLIMPHFLYGSELYSGANAGTIHRLKLCFNSCIRFIFGLRIRDHVSEYARNFLDTDFDTFLNLRVLILLFKIIKFRYPQYLYEKLRFTNSERVRHLIIPPHSSAIMDKSFLIRASRLWNSLELSIREANSVPAFKSLCLPYLNNRNANNLI